MEKKSNIPAFSSLILDLWPIVFSYLDFWEYSTLLELPTTNISSSEPKNVFKLWFSKSDLEQIRLLWLKNSTDYTKLIAELIESQNKN